MNGGRLSAVVIVEGRLREETLLASCAKELRVVGCNVLGVATR
jgi:hypothetical protein